jgi:ketosteroid isomerase-like protein
VRIKRTIISTIVGAAVLLGLAQSDVKAHGSGHAAAPPTKSKAQVVVPTVDIDIQFRNALSAGNAALAASYLSDDVLIFEDGSVERSKNEYQSHHLAADIAFARATRYEVLNRVIRVWGNTAISTTEGKTTGNWNGRPINSLGTETMVMRRGDGRQDDGQWRITHIHWSSH